MFWSLDALVWLWLCRFCTSSLQLFLFSSLIKGFGDQISNYKYIFSYLPLITQNFSFNCPGFTVKQWKWMELCVVGKLHFSIEQQNCSQWVLGRINTLLEERYFDFFCFLFVFMVKMKNYLQMRVNWSFTSNCRCHVMKPWTALLLALMYEHQQFIHICHDIQILSAGQRTDLRSVTLSKNKTRHEV